MPLLQSYELKNELVLTLVNFAQKQNLVRDKISFFDLLMKFWRLLVCVSISWATIFWYFSLIAIKILTLHSTIKSLARVWSRASSWQSERPILISCRPSRWRPLFTKATPLTATSLARVCLLRAATSRARLQHSTAWNQWPRCKKATASTSRRPPCAGQAASAWLARAAPPWLLPDSTRSLSYENFVLRFKTREADVTWLFHTSILGLRILDFQAQIRPVWVPPLSVVSSTIYFFDDL